MIFFERYKPFSLLILLLSTILYGLILFQILRSNFFQFISCFAGLIIGCIYLIKKSNLSTAFLSNFSIAIRVIAIFSLPSLSNDFYRFIWDGLLWQEGTNPYSLLPSQYILLHSSNSYLQYLYTQLNSPIYYSVYPPLLQVIFRASVSLFSTHILGTVAVMKCCIVLAEIGTIHYLKKYLTLIKKEEKLVLWYALNPVVIIELSGNLHFEAFMIFGVVTFLYYLESNKILKATVALSVAVCSKIIPLIFVPILLFKLPLKKSIVYSALLGTIFIGSFVAFTNLEGIQNIFTSFQLYFKTFEFNASVYYIIRHLGFAIKGYNTIQITAPYISVFIFFSVLLITMNKKLTIAKKSLFILSIYMALATVVHPWYAIPLLALGIMSGYYYPLLFSFVLPLTYYPYSLPIFKENLWLIGICYSLVYVWSFWEIAVVPYQLKRNSKTF